MFSGNDKISIRQLQILLILTLFTSVSLILPRITTEYAKQNGWLLIIGAAVLTMLYSYFITTLGKMFPDKTIVEYSQEIVTKPIGSLICWILVIKLIIFLGLEIRIFGELVKQTLLSNTPIEFIMIIMLFTAVYLTRKGYEPRARIAELIIFLGLIPIMLVLLFALQDIRLDRLAPFFTIKASEFVAGSYFISTAMVGIEFLYIAIPFLRTPQKVTKAVMQTVIFVAILNLMINFITVGLFGPIKTAREIWPVMTIMQVIELPGAFISRQDALMMSFWILTTFGLINCYIFFISILTSRLIKSKEANWINLLVIPIVYVIALVPNNVPHTFETIKRLIQLYGIIFVLPVPILLLGIAKIRKLGVKDDTKQN
ncbi:MAG: hypothetical protein CVU84_07850 [Firmicutes bacterium HGW-Firmicutes-1]|jgi:spore germination protein|nr:MAG: hypothetical protein CVU84_07850 [Firmicutes bacterium HGW-Firmicutes-1]